MVVARSVVYRDSAECWAIRKKEERKLHTMRMLRWARGKTRLDNVRNEHIWKETHMYPMAEFLREKRLRWFGHVQRRGKDDAMRNILQTTVDGKRNRGRPKLKWRDQPLDGETSAFITLTLSERLHLERRHSRRAIVDFEPVAPLLDWGRSSECLQ